jgi:hypothetical protein
LAAHKRGCARKNLPNNTITVKWVNILESF